MFWSIITLTTCPSEGHIQTRQPLTLTFTTFDQPHFLTSMIYLAKGWNGSTWRKHTHTSDLLALKTSALCATVRLPSHGLRNRTRQQEISLNPMLHYTKKEWTRNIFEMSGMYILIHSLCSFSGEPQHNLPINTSLRSRSSALSVNSPCLLWSRKS